MNKTVLVIIAALMVMAIMVTPVFAEKPVTMTLTGTMVVLGIGDGTTVVAGESDNRLIKLRNTPCLWTGGISGSGFSNGNWLVKGGPITSGGEIANAVGGVYLEDVTVAGVGSGDLTLGYSGLDYWIESGSDDLRSIRGTGTFTIVSAIKYNYVFVIKINP